MNTYLSLSQTEVTVSLKYLLADMNSKQPQMMIFIQCRLNQNSINFEIKNKR